MRQRRSPISRDPGLRRHDDPYLEKWGDQMHCRLMNDTKYPPAWRLALGFLIAPPLIWLALTWGSPLPAALDPEWASADARERFSFALLFATYIGYPSALLFGLPIFVLLERRRNDRAYDNARLAVPARLCCR